MRSCHTFNVQIQVSFPVWSPTSMHHTYACLISSHLFARHFCNIRDCPDTSSLGSLCLSTLMQYGFCCDVCAVQIVFGDEGPQRDQKGNAHGNNYSRPGGQNVGNFIGDRPSSRVSAPAGGKSQVICDGV
eukprot:365679-Chlamydomonas_euryale.AAC.23